jgi:heme exporter protein C
MTAGVLMTAFYAPVDTSGIAQKIFYAHLPSALACMLSTTLVFVGSAGFIFKERQGLDRLARSSAGPAWIFCTITLLTGSLWAKSEWGVWWTWDPRLVTFMILWCILTVYVMLRKSLAPGPSRGRVAAPVGIIAFMDLILTLAGVHIWKTIHPQVITASQVRMDTSMLHTLLVMSVAVIIVNITLIYLRYRIFLINDSVERLTCEG